MNFKRIVTLVLFALCPWLMAQEEGVDPRAVLEGARMSATLTQLDEGLTGHLRSDGGKVPVTLFLKGEDIQFQFAEDGGSWQIFHMRIGDERFQLFEIVDGRTRRFDREKLVSPVAGTDLTYEDLAMRFFYWPDPELMGVEEIGGQECYKIRVRKPAQAEGRYEVVHVWVHTKFGAFMRICGYNAAGKLLKEFQVEDVMKVDDNIWTLRKMQVSTYNEESGRRSSITDLTFDKPNKRKALRGLR